VLRAARAGTLATAIDGQPFASLVTPATAPDASVLLLLSDLSEHTRHLRADGRCAVMVAGEPGGPNAQTAPRVTITGIATIEPDPALRARWVATHPYAAFYAGFGDFNLWRVKPVGALFVGGFARAHRLRQAELVSDAPEVWAAEAGVIAHCNADHADALDAIAGAGSGWQMVACDADGFDLCLGEVVRRVAWAAPVEDAGAIRAALVTMVKAARESG
jgi:putative heme iron utilization protein